MSFKRSANKDVKEVDGIIPKVQARYYLLEGRSGGNHNPVNRSRTFGDDRAIYGDPSQRIDLSKKIALLLEPAEFDGGHNLPY
jgi:hypothetical protein